MKKILCIFLTLVMILSVASGLTSCSAIFGTLFGDEQESESASDLVTDEDTKEKEDDSDKKVDTEESVENGNTEVGSETKGDDVVDSEDIEESDDVEESEEESEDEEEDSEYEYTPPSVDYNGRDFNVFTWDASKDWVNEFASELSSIDAQTYIHLRNVESELGIKFNIARKEKGNYDQRNDFISKIYMLSGTDGIDLICQYSLAASLGAQQSLYVNLRELEYITWDAPYWSGSFTDENTINDKMFYCTGDLTGSVILNMFLMTFNKDLAETYDMGDIYDIVREGDWTIEKLRILTTGIHEDVNGNGKDVGDTFGLVVGEYNIIDAFQYGADLRCLNVNSDNELEINPDLVNARGIAIVEALKDLMHANTGAYCATKQIPAYSAMQSGNAVFAPMIADGIIGSLSTTDINYGILPMPKYDKDQKEYHTSLGMVYSMFAVPVVANDPDMSGAVLESMAHDGYENLNPVIYDALRYKYSNSRDDIEMFEILRNGIIYDSGRILDFIDIFALVRRTVRDNTELVSYFEAQESVFNEGIKEANFMFS